MDNDRDNRIRQRAHQLWEEQGRPEGRDAEHWDQARRELDGDDMPQPHRLQEDPPEGDRDKIEAELARRQQDDVKGDDGQQG